MIPLTHETGEGEVRAVCDVVIFVYNAAERCPGSIIGVYEMYDTSNGVQCTS